MIAFDDFIIIIALRINFSLLDSIHTNDSEYHT